MPCVDEYNPRHIYETTALPSEDFSGGIFLFLEIWMNVINCVLLPRDYI